MQGIRKRNLTGRMLFRLLKAISSSFPANKVRVWALRCMGFSVGKDVYVGPGLTISAMNSDDSCSLIIGDRVSIGPEVCLVLASDPNNSRLAKLFPAVRGRIQLQADCWLGARCIILPDVIIGEAAVVAAGAVVTKNVEGYSVVAGVPAQVKRKIDPTQLS